MQHNTSNTHKLHASALQIFRETERRTANLRRQWIGLLLTGIVWVMAACTSSEPSGITSKTEATPSALRYAAPWPVSTADSGGRVLQLSKTTVTPGEIITRTVTASNFPTDVTSTMMTLEQHAGDGWRTIYYMGLLSPPADYLPMPNETIPAAGITPAAVALRIPNVPAGSYRVRQDMLYGNPPISITLYAPLQVVTSATPSP